MGINRQDLEIIIALREAGLLPDGGAVAEIGAQQLSPSFLEANNRTERLRELFGVTEAKPPFPMEPPAAGDDEHLPADAPRARLFWQSLGLRYTAIDIDGSPNAIPLDLNFDSVPSNFSGHFDLVTNFGTTEHLANQLN